MKRSVNDPVDSDEGSGDVKATEPRQRKIPPFGRNLSG